MNAVLLYVTENEQPPGGYRFRVEATGTVIEAWTLPSMYERVINHLQANRLPIPGNIQDIIQDQSCQRHRNKCYESSGIKRVTVSVKSIMGALAAIAPWVARGRPCVSQEAADVRATTCSSCPYNALPRDCAPCQAQTLLNMLKSLIGPRKTSKESVLESCQVCGCALKVKVWLPIEDISRAKLFHNPALPDWCWVKTES